MEKYRISEHGMELSIKFGNYFNSVNKKHIDAYGKNGADNIVENIVETYKEIHYQLASPQKNNNVLLVGKVQSGKTSNLELLTALAFDNGYNILVIYGGYDTSLLKQTTDRFRMTFDATGEITYDNNAPAIFTTDDSNQILSIDDEIMTDLLENNKPVIFVSMKRPVALKKINSLLRRLDKSEFKAFIIDDEGDQASLNNAKDKIKDSSATYKEIVDMKELLEDPMYLSVTATPHANIFLDDWSALRPDSIRLIQPGRGYNGAQIYHLYENEIVQLVSEEDHEELANGNIPESLWDAVNYFIVASAIKRKKAETQKDRYSDMIIHTFREVSQHSSIYTHIESYIKSMKASFVYEDEDMVRYLSVLEACFNKNVSGVIKSEFVFNDIKAEIANVVKKTKVILKNSVGKTTQGNENLKWHKIYIGGDLLQRGLTFSNLVTTYFTRWATNGGNMDTNLQRARWFGYRSKYIDLCKIFTTAEIAQEFTNLAEIEEDLWDQFADVENGTLSIDDILIQSENTKQNPTNKQRVKYKKVSFKNRWIKQKYLVNDNEKIVKNNAELERLFESIQWKVTTAGSRVGNVTGKYAYFDTNTLKELLNVIQGTFDYDPFQKKALIDLLGQDNIPVILIGDEKNPRYRSIYKQSFRIKALQQGADSIVAERITYEGDSSVLIDKNQINIQVHKIVPGEDKSHPLTEKMQYMFAIYIPKEKTYFIKGN
ncbi:MAG: hypothetical protein HFG45_06690 [Oscillospiraceae bacterium]|jgi:hypothetical protein|nr:hypothetical protein [Oscillospiraceae bacterium]